MIVKIRLARDRKSGQKPASGKRLIRRSVKVNSGVATLSVRVPRGLKPSLVSVSYPGNDALLPGTIRRKAASVSKLTR